ncbi:MAG: methyltransferase [candidate division WOR-3 bacterium]
MLYFSKPNSTFFLSHILIISGLSIRLWATGYIGEKARTKELNAFYRIVSGPYRILRHPLYIGNFFLVMGTVFLYNPPFWLKIIIILAFLIEYSIIIITEEEYLKGLPALIIKFSFKKLKFELSTILIMVVIYLIYFWILSSK